MRLTSKSAVCVAAMSLGLLLLFCASVRPEDAKNAKPDIKELQQKRLALLGKVHDVVRNLYQNARIEYGEAHAAQAEYFAARREYAETREERIKACDEAIEEALEWQKLAEALKISARATEIGILRSKAYLLEMQIERAKAEAEK
ncbi:MAG TPA: hypothetical protein VMF30_19625 [Pirellulales bacterium]|nr:hypothetical protein [Pirellulales bacterium]